MKLIFIGFSQVLLVFCYILLYFPTFFHPRGPVNRWKWFLPACPSSLNPPGPSKKAKNLSFRPRTFAEKFGKKSLLALYIPFLGGTPPGEMDPPGASTPEEVPVIDSALAMVGSACWYRPMTQCSLVSRQLPLATGGSFSGGRGGRHPPWGFTQRFSLNGPHPRGGYTRYRF